MPKKCALLAIAAGVLLCRGGDDVQQRLAGRAFSANAVMQDLAELCDRVGGPSTGSPACSRAIEWGVDKFKSIGVDSVTTESFTVPQLWLPEAVEAECLAPERFTIRLAAAPYSASTAG